MLRICLRRVLHKARCWNAKLGKRGQSLVEYLLVLLVAFTMARIIYFNPTVGIQPNLEKTMLKLGSFLEANLKSGTQPGPQGDHGYDQYAGTGNWRN